jgi:threonine aldolase
MYQINFNFEQAGISPVQLNNVAPGQSILEVALENNIERLAQDHAHAKQLAAVLSDLDFVGEILPVETNIIIFEVKGRYTATELIKALQPFNIFAFTVSEHQIRFVLHLDITPAMVEETIAVLHKL